MTKFPLPSLGPGLPSPPRPAPTLTLARDPGAPTTSKHASPSVSELILWAVATSPKCQGLSLEALKKIITKAGYDVVRNKTHFLRNLVPKGVLQQLKGTGALGSFGIGKGMGKKRESSAQEGGLPKTGSRKPGRKRKAGAEGSSQGARMPASQAGQQPVKVGGRTSKARAVRTKQPSPETG
uniref:H15 domain-containing protein n=1 Tax=Chelydra serpentina TaxID=8475 RepID=A0A8C3TJT5_CHESE